jgi:N-terminal acetyltransferase B complex non-catalytic subunit
VWKANVLFNHADETHKKRGITETLQLCNAEPAISDLDTLDILHRTLQKMDDHTELRSVIWEKAAKAKPQDHTLQMRWFTLGFEASDWKTAQKVSSGCLHERGMAHRQQIADDQFGTCRLL